MPYNILEDVSLRAEKLNLNDGPGGRKCQRKGSESLSKNLNIGVSEDRRRVEEQIGLRTGGTIKGVKKINRRKKRGNGLPDQVRGDKQFVPNRDIT